jgi:hypothetical protein
VKQALGHLVANHITTGELSDGNLFYDHGLHQNTQNLNAHATVQQKPQAHNRMSGGDWQRDDFQQTH